MTNVIAFPDGDDEIQVISSKTTAHLQFVLDRNGDLGSPNESVRVAIWRVRDDEFWPSDDAELKNQSEKIRAELLIAATLIEECAPISYVTVPMATRAAARLLKKLSSN